MTFNDDQTPDNSSEENAEAQGKDNLDLKNLENQPENTEADLEEGEIDGERLGAVYEVPVKVSAVLGKADMQVNQLLKLGRGAVIELDRKVGEAIDIYVNDRLVARGEIVVVGERLGVTMTEIIKADKHAA